MLVINILTVIDTTLKTTFYLLFKVDKSQNMVLVDFSSEPDSNDPFKHLKMMPQHEVYKHVQNCNHGAEHIKQEPERVKVFVKQI